MSREQTESESAAEAVEAAEVTAPGLWTQRKRAVKEVEEHGGAPVIYFPWLNRGTNFSPEEREQLRLEGLLPPVVESLDLQAERVLCQLKVPNQTDLQRYSILSQLLSSNQTLFFKVVMDHLERCAPLIYTPTVGEACRKFDHIFRAPLGMYLSAFRHRGRFKQVLRNWPSRNVQILVVTDGSRVLGLGDLGTNGVGISIGKVCLYVAGGGFHPEHSLPLVLDAGCDRQELRDDPFYMGERQPRLQGEEYYGAVEELCAAVKSLWPNALLQFEDFSTERAFEILHRQRDKLLCFNDDIQGTGSVVTAGVVNGLKFQKTELRDARLLFYGAGSSALGVADSITAFMRAKAGMSWEEARRCIYMVDSKGLITTTRGDTLAEHKKRYARDDGSTDHKELEDIMGDVKPHALIGLSAAGPSWPQPVIKRLSACVDCPLIFPLSNPTEKAEITAEDAYRWCGGKCVFASGSPFPPVEVEGATFVPGQGNNVFIFCGVGFGAVMAKARVVNDDMFVAASQALADCVSEKQLRAKQIYPDIADLREVSAQVAAAVACAAFETGVSGLAAAPASWLEYVKERAWWPDGRTTRVAGCPQGVCDSGAGGTRPRLATPSGARHPPGHPAHQ